MPNNTGNSEAERRRVEAWSRIEQLQKELAEAPKYDSRSLAEILEDMYDENGLPK